MSGNVCLTQVEMYLKDIKYLSIVSRLLGFELQLGHLSVLSFLGAGEEIIVFSLRKSR